MAALRSLTPMIEVWRTLSYCCTAKATERPISYRPRDSLALTSRSPRTGVIQPRRTTTGCWKSISPTRRSRHRRSSNTQARRRSMRWWPLTIKEWPQPRWPASSLACRTTRRQRLAATRNKADMRQRLKSAGVRQPAFEVVTADSDSRIAAEGVGFPVVVKPVSLSASQGVIRVDRAEPLTGNDRANALNRPGPRTGSARAGPCRALYPWRRSCR